MAQRPYIVGNWKMHGTRAMLAEARAIDRAAERLIKAEVALAPPYTLIHATHREATLIGVGAQDCFAADGGAHTGDISAAMLKDAGASFVIVGHSERRADHGESDAIVKAKAEAALAAGLGVIVCVGESEADRDAGRAVKIVTSQLARFAAGQPPKPWKRSPLPMSRSGRSAADGPRPSTRSAQCMRAIRKKLLTLYGQGAGDVRILYGGSVKADNAPDILRVPEVGGALVGGASLAAESFLAIIVAAAELADG